VTTHSLLNPLFGAAAFAAVLTFGALGSAPASAAPACPGGGVQKCTPKCSGPITRPVCTYGPPCTCTMSKLPTDKAARADRGTGGGSGGGSRPPRADSVGTKGTVSKVNERSFRNRRDR
jgi:hypothetical protein